MRARGEAAAHTPPVEYRYLTEFQSHEPEVPHPLHPPIKTPSPITLRFDFGRSPLFLHRCVLCVLSTVTARALRSPRCLCRVI